MRPAGPAVPLPLSAREPVLSNEKARGGDPGPRYVSLSLPVVRSCCSRSRGARVSYQIDAGPGRCMFPVGGDIPGTLKPSASSRVYRVPLFGARGRARAVGVAKGCRRWEENPAHVLSATVPVLPSARTQRTSMDAARRPAPAGRPPRWRRVSTLLTLMLLMAACTTAGGHSGTSAATGHTPPPPSGAPLSTSPGAPGSAPGPAVSISAVGDIIMGSTPQLPPEDGRHLFDGVTGQVPGTVALANMDQALTDDAAVSKCGATSSDCYAFRTRPRHHRRRVINDHPGRSTRPF